MNLSAGIFPARISASAAALWLLMIAGCHQVSPSRLEPVVPVQVMKLEVSHPERSLRLTGSAKPWREEHLAFELQGRVATVRDDRTVVGLVARELPDGSLDARGEVVATLDPVRYEANVAAAQAQWEAAKAKVKYLQVELEQLTEADINMAGEKVAATEILVESILPSELSAARADLELASAEHDRARSLYLQEAGTRAAYDQAVARLQAALSSYQKSLANITAKKRELASAQAELAKAEAGRMARRAQQETAQAEVAVASALLRLAHIDLEHCQLSVPFSGVISTRHVTRGAVVGPNQPVVTITMMDPIKVEVSVSAEMARSIQEGDPVQVFPPMLEGSPIGGFVRSKSVSADPLTRTHLISCMIRNRQVPMHHKQKPAQGIPYSGPDDIELVIRDDTANPDSPLMVGVSCLQRDAQGMFAWVIQNVRIGQGVIRSGTFTVSKVPLRLGQGFKTFGGSEFREVLEPSGLQEGMPTLKPHLPGLRDGAEIVYLPFEWAIHPGDLVPLQFMLAAYPEGIYIPLETIRNEPRGTSVFVVREGVARQLPVQLHEPFGNLRRVTADEQLAGQELVILGTHYLHSGDRVTETRFGAD